MAEDETSVISVGQKPSMAYVLETLNMFGAGRTQVRITAKGKAVSRAVDVAEAVRRKFVICRVASIEIGTEERELPDKSKASVSTIEIVLAKQLD